MAGRHEEAVPAAEQAVASARRLGLNDLIGTSLAGLAMSEEALGRVASARGHIASPFRIVRSPSARQFASARARRSARAGSPTRRRTSAADFGITGSSRMAATRTASATSNSTWLR